MTLAIPTEQPCEFTVRVLDRDLMRADLPPSKVWAAVKCLQDEAVARGYRWESWYSWEHLATFIRFRRE